MLSGTYSYPSTDLRSRDGSETVPNCLASLEIEFLRLLAAVMTSSNCGTSLSWMNSRNWNILIETNQNIYFTTKWSKSYPEGLCPLDIYLPHLSVKMNELGLGCRVFFNQTSDLLLSEKLQKHVKWCYRDTDKKHEMQLFRIEYMQKVFFFYLKERWFVIEKGSISSHSDLPPVPWSPECFATGSGGF